jgi:hypothetical protein
MRELDKFFDGLKKQLDALHSDTTRDNEAVRHDRLILPMLTSKFTLMWEVEDLWSQQQITVPNEVSKSFIFPGSVPKRKRPDVIIQPIGISDPLIVVEEKAYQASVSALLGYNAQIRTYQEMCSSIWGLLTDGEKWIVKRHLETYLVFESIDELRKGFRDFQEAIGKEAMLSRVNSYGTADMLIVVHVPILTPSHTIVEPIESQIRLLNAEIFSLNAEIFSLDTQKSKLQEEFEYADKMVKDLRDNASSATSYYDAPKYGMSGSQYDVAAEEAMEYLWTPAFHDLHDAEAKKQELLRQVKSIMDSLDAKLKI